LCEKVKRNGGRKGINGRRLEQKQMEEEYCIIAKWAQEDVETLYSLLNGRRKMWEHCRAC
jgi:hypothetical protein